MSEQREMFLFCGSDSDKHKGKILPVVDLIEVSPGVWLERIPGGRTVRLGEPFVTSSGFRGRFSVRPGHSPPVRLPFYPLQTQCASARGEA